MEPASSARNRESAPTATPSPPSVSTATIASSTRPTSAPPTPCASSSIASRPGPHEGSSRDPCFSGDLRSAALSSVTFDALRLGLARPPYGPLPPALPPAGRLPPHLLPRPQDRGRWLVLAQRPSGRKQWSGPTPSVCGGRERSSRQGVAPAAESISGRAAVQGVVAPA